MLSGNRDLSKSVQNPIPLINVHPCNSRHTQYGIHRSTDIMTHPGQKVALCKIGSLCPLRCQSKHLLLFLFLMNNLINTAHGQRNGSRMILSCLSHSDHSRTPLIFPIFSHSFVLNLNMVFFLHLFQYLRQVQKIFNRLFILFCNQP